MPSGGLESMVGDGEGNIYYHYFNGFEQWESVVVGLDRKGEIIFKTNPIVGLVTNMPAIGANGTLYYTMYLRPHKLIAIQ